MNRKRGQTNIVTTTNGSDDSESIKRLNTLPHDRQGSALITDGSQGLLLEAQSFDNDEDNRPNSPRFGVRSPQNVQFRNGVMFNHQDKITDSEASGYHQTYLTTEVLTKHHKTLQTQHSDVENNQNFRASILNSQLSQEQKIKELKQEACKILKDEQDTGWWGIFLMLACVRQFSFYLILITFWIHIFQIKMNLYYGALGYLALYGSKILGTNLVRYSLMKQLPLQQAHKASSADSRTSANDQQALGSQLDGYIQVTGGTVSGSTPSQHLHVSSHRSHNLLSNSNAQANNNQLDGNVKINTVFQSKLLSNGNGNTAGYSAFGQQATPFWETLKAYLILSVIFSLVASLLMFCIKSGSLLGGFLLTMCFILFGASQGVQSTAEEIYIYNSIDKSLVEWTQSGRKLAELAGATAASALSYLLTSLCQPSTIAATTTTELVIDEEIRATSAIVSDPTMRIALATVILLASILTLILATCMFTEMPLARRAEYRALKYSMKDIDGIEQLISQQVEKHTFSGTDEWIRMKDSPPNTVDVRATLQLNFVVALMFSLPVTVVGLQLCLLTADLSVISTCFLVATLCSWIAHLVARSSVTTCGKPATLITLGILLGLVSSFLLIDYKRTNSTSEKLVESNLDIVQRNLIIGLTLSMFGYTLSSMGIEAQFKDLMPRRQYLAYQGNLVTGQCLGAIFGALWASIFLILTESTALSFIPFIGVAVLFITVLLTCLRNRLRPHDYFSIKQQEKLLRKHLLERKNAEDFSQRRYGQEPAVPTYYESLDTAELANPYPVCQSSDPNILQSHRSLVSQHQRTPGGHSRKLSQQVGGLRSNYRSGTNDSQSYIFSRPNPNIIQTNSAMTSDNTGN